MKDWEWKNFRMGEVSDEARDIAVKWCEDNNYDWILDKVKLASDLENYARWYFHQQMVANNHKFAIKGENMREGTQYVQVNITSKHDGNDSSSTSGLVVSDNSAKSSFDT